MKIIQKENRGTKEYSNAYTNGNLTRYDEATDTYIAPELKEAKVVAKDYNPVGVKVSKELNNIGNNIAQNAIEFSPLAPVLGATQIVTSYLPNSANYGEHDKAWKRLGIDIATLGAFAAAKPVLQVTSKALKQPIKKYGTQLANKLENRFPNAVDRFHTWNAKDNINNMLMHEVVKNKKSRLRQNSSEYTDVDRIWIKDELKGTGIAEKEIDRYSNSIMPDFLSRRDKIDFTKEMPIEDAIYHIGNTYKNITDHRTLHKLAEDVRLGSISGSESGIHIGTKRFSSFSPEAIAEKGQTVSSFNKGTVYSHELDHYVSIPTTKEFIDIVKSVGASNIDKYFSSKNKKYLMQRSGTEVKARLGQLKDLFGLDGKTPISLSQLKTAIKMYNNSDKYKLLDNMLGVDKALEQSDIQALQKIMNTTSLKNGGKI